MLNQRGSGRRERSRTRTQKRARKCPSVCVSENGPPDTPDAKGAAPLPCYVRCLISQNQTDGTEGSLGSLGFGPIVSGAIGKTTQTHTDRRAQRWSDRRMVFAERPAEKDEGDGFYQKDK